MLNQFNARVLYPLAEKRLGRAIRPKLAELQRAHALPPEARLELKKNQLYKILSVAKVNVPYYRDLFAKIQFNPESILKDLRAIEEIPYLTKDILREHDYRLVNESIAPELLHVRKTGGSTGVSTKIYYDQDGLDWTAAVNLFAQSFTGRTHELTEAHLSTKFTDTPSRRDIWVEKIKCMAMNRVNIHTHAFSDDGLADVWRRIRSERPYLVQGHPSTLYALAKYIERSGQYDKSAIRVFESTGESIDAKKIEAIESQIGCKVYNRYGTAEFGVTAHSRDDANALEIIDYIIHHETVTLPDGLSEIVGTNTTNLAMPLIRYRSGDVGEIKKMKDASGNERDYLVNLQGRVHDLIEIAGKAYPTHYLLDILDRIGGVSEFQIVQKKDHSQVLNIVLEKEDRKDAIVSKINQVFNGSMPVHFVNIDQLIRVGWRDKFRYIVKEP